ncbi:hypothetical protein C8R46DRAFT_1220959 [Mycena filopes]|nr:hypothetical protein C8R46DRAFT_1220959 [Mycena filopes]
MHAMANHNDEHFAARAARRNASRFNPAQVKHRKHQNTVLSEDAKRKIRRAVSHAWADATVDKYARSLDAFHIFCDGEGVTPAQRLPANEFLLCAFAASRLGEIAGGTAKNALSAVKAWHVLEDVHWEGGLRLRYTLRGVENLGPGKLDLRPPVTADMVALLGEELNLADPFDAAVFSTACSAFWGQIRLGEILSETQAKFKTGRIPLVSDLKPASTAAGSRILRLPWTKTKKRAGDNVMLCRQSGKSDPIAAAENHLRVNNLPANAPLTAYRNAGGAVTCLTKKKFLRRCNEVWKRHGYPTYTGLSFRIGGTTELLLAGGPPRRCAGDGKVAVGSVQEILEAS